MAQPRLYDEPMTDQLWLRVPRGLKRVLNRLRVLRYGTTEGDAARNVLMEHAEKTLAREERKAKRKARKG